MKKANILILCGILLIAAYVAVRSVSQIELMRVAQTFDPEKRNLYHVGSWVDNQREITHNSWLAKYSVVQQRDDNQVITPINSQRSIYGYYYGLPLLGLILCGMGFGELVFHRKSSQ